MDIVEQVLQCYREGKRYQETARALSLDKNKIYSITKKLVDAGCLRKMSAGRYEVVSGVSLPLAKQRNSYKRREKAEVIQEPAPVEIPAPPPAESLETIATTLLGKIGYLQPLLLLHKELFDEIQQLTLEIVNQLTESQPRTLSNSEFEEWGELKVIKQRAQVYAARHQ